MAPRCMDSIIGMEALPSTRATVVHPSSVLMPVMGAEAGRIGVDGMDSVASSQATGGCEQL
jgi:hypothetical protein